MSLPSDLNLTQPNLKTYRKSFEHRGAGLWNSNKPSVMIVVSTQRFKMRYLRLVLD